MGNSFPSRHDAFIDRVSINGELLKGHLFDRNGRSKKVKCYLKFRASLWMGEGMDNVLRICYDKWANW